MSNHFLTKTPPAVTLETGCIDLEFTRKANAIILESDYTFNLFQHLWFKGRNSVERVSSGQYSYDSFKFKLDEGYFILKKQKSILSISDGNYLDPIMDETWFWDFFKQLVGK